jgi:hypothetical protein
MPHDRNGNILSVGDIVMVPCRVKAIHLTADYCNVDLETTERMHPLPQPSAFSLNSKQVVKPWPNERGDHVVFSPAPQEEPT